MKQKTVLIVLFALFAACFQIQSQKKPKAYIVSNAHFDTQWNWDVQTSIDQYIFNTIDQNLFLLEKYPDYIFNFEGGIKYAWMKEYYPNHYERMKKFIDEGRWKVCGSTWDANDANIPSPESFIRNVLYGQQFYQDEFNVKGTDIFLPDCFGFGWTLPTIANHCGLIGFSTQKLQWRNKPFYGTGKIPFEIGLWQGVDGAKIMLVADAHNYTTKFTDEDISQNKDLIRLAESSPIKTVYHYYGTGDIGGSPTIESVRSVEKGLKGNGPIEIISAASDQLYKDYLPFDNHPELPVHIGELLMDVHGTGCYTSQSAMKLYNRKNELLGDAAERAAVMADWLGGMTYPQETLTESWKRFIWHQFHDDLTGTSIPRAYEFSWNDELLSQKQFAQVLTTSTGSIAEGLDTEVKGTPVIIYNPISQPVKDIVEVNINVAKPVQGLSVYNENGKLIPSQFISWKAGIAKLLIAAEVAPVSFTVYDVRIENKHVKSNINVSGNTIENAIYKVTLNNNGDISSIIDKRNDRELVKSGKTIRLALFTENESFNWPAWEILKKTIDQQPVDITQNVKISVAEEGNLRGALCIERTYNNSTFKQYIRLTDGGQDDRIDFVSQVDWQTSNALLKAEFPLNISNEKATYDLGIGQVQRGNNTETAYEVCAQYWADLTDSDRSYGVSILNDSKYGWDKPDNNTLRLTLLHTPKTKGGYAYQDKQDLGYHEFTYSLTGHTGDCTAAKTVWKAETLNQSLKAFTASKHKGKLGKVFSFAQTNSDQIILKSFKKAEKSDNYIVRFYETTGNPAQNMELTLPGTIVSAEELNGAEDAIGKAAIEGNKLKFSMSPFSIKTFSVQLQSPDKQMQQPSSLPLALNYTMKTATFNAFRSNANFDGKGNSYAAELFPKKLICDGIRFEFGEKEVRNGLKCEGDTIELPQNGNYNKLYFLAASTYGNNEATFLTDDKAHNFVIPYYSGFIGQWEHTDHTEGFFNPGNVAYVGTHKHSMKGNKDLPYEFTYMFKFSVDIPKNAKRFILPNNPRIVIFAATLAQNTTENVYPATNLITTSLKENHFSVNTSVERTNLLYKKTSIANSGEVNRYEKAIFAADKDISTKWCDISDNSPKYIEFDLQKPETIKGWFVYHAGNESLSYITKEYCLEVKNDLNDPWKIIDKVENNTEPETDRLLPQPIMARYVRLTVNKPDQDEGNVARIYEFEVY